MAQHHTFIPMYTSRLMMQSLTISFLGSKYWITRPVWRQCTLFVDSAVLLTHLPLEMLKSDHSVKQVQIPCMQSKAKVKKYIYILNVLILHQLGFVHLCRSYSWWRQKQMSMYLNNCDDKMLYQCFTSFASKYWESIFLQALVLGPHVLRRETADSLCIPGFKIKSLLSA